MWPYEAVQSTQAVTIDTPNTDSDIKSTSNKTIIELKSSSLSSSSMSLINIGVESEYAQTTSSLGDGFVFGIADGMLVHDENVENNVLLERKELVTFASMNSTSSMMHVCIPMSCTIILTTK